VSESRDGAEFYFGAIMLGYARAEMALTQAPERFANFSGQTP
jgi:hypothetical protein